MQSIPSPRDCFSSRVLPVVNLSSIEQAKRVLQLLMDAGIDGIELTLRNHYALDVLHWFTTNQEDIAVGVGTVCQPLDLRQAVDAGARFAVSPGYTKELIQMAKQLKIPYWPGVVTPSDILQVVQEGYLQAKFFPAQQAGGINMLKAFSGPFPAMSFCPTGGITQDNVEAYLALGNVACVGGSWLIDAENLRQNNWQEMHQRCQWVGELNRLPL